MDEDERRRKVEAGRAMKSFNMPRSQSLTSFRQKRAKSDSAGPAKKTQTRKGQDVPKNDRPAQVRHLEPAAPSANDPKKNTHEEPLKTKKLEIHKNRGQKACSQPQSHSPSPQSHSPSPQSHSPCPDEEPEYEELLALTGKEQLEQLQQAVEKRNEIIARLSANLQEAQADRDQVQLQAQSLAAQIQALQRQLQQTGVEFQRIKSQSGAEALQAPCVPSQPGHEPQDGVFSHIEVPLGHPEIASFASLSSGFENTDSKPRGDSETEALLNRLRTNLEQERLNGQKICSELAKEKENCQRVLLLLEEEKRGRVEEKREREVYLADLQMQLSQAQSQCLEIQQYKEEKEQLNGEMQELRRQLKEEQENLGKEKELWEEEMRRFKAEHREEVGRIQGILEEKEKELEVREKADSGVKASKNRQNQETACFGYELGLSAGGTDLGGEHGQGEGSEDGLDGLVSGDLPMERYLSSALLAQPCSSLAIEKLEKHSLLDNSANFSFELNSEIFGDHVSFSHSVDEDNEDPHNHSIPQSSAGAFCIADRDDSTPRSPSGWPVNSFFGHQEVGELSEQPCEESNLEKELLSQQCTELREELAIKERDLNVLHEEVSKSAEDLKEARSRWGQVTTELQEALWALEEEKVKRRTQEEEVEDEREKRKSAEEEINVRANEQNNLKNRLSALLEERDGGRKEKLGREEVEASSLFLPSHPSAESENLLRELKEAKEEKAVLLSRLKQQEMKLAEDSVSSEVQELLPQLQTLQVLQDHGTSELEESNTRIKTMPVLLDQKTLKLDAALEDLNTTRLQSEAVQKELEETRRSLERTEKQKEELEGQLKQSLTSLEEAQVKEREEHRLKVEELDAQMKKMEQVLEEELEQYEKLIKAKDDELAEQKEKWEAERQEKWEDLAGVSKLLEEQKKERKSEVKALLAKQALAVEEATENLKRSHREEVEKLMEKHQVEVSEWNSRLERELSEQKASLEEEQTRQISLIKQVTEREHQRIISERCAKHREELSQLRMELSSELKEACRQTEMQHTQAKRSLEMEALRLSLTNLHTTQLELSQANLQRERDAALSEVQASLREKWEQETAILQAKQQFELERIKEHHRQDLDEVKHQWETRVSEERAAMETKHAEDIQALRSDFEEEAERSNTSLQTSLSDTQKNLADCQEKLNNTEAKLLESQASLVQARSDLNEDQVQLEEQQTSSRKEIQRLEEELSQAWGDRDAAARAVEELVSTHKSVLKEREQHVCHLEEKEEQLRQEVLCLQEEKASLKLSSEQEFAQLWAQLESMRTSRQELGELKEQLLARSSRVEDIERIKVEFNDQRREIKEQNEAELESLRRYFEKRLRVAEEGYREEITLMQLRLVEGALAESVLKTADSSFVSEAPAEEDKNALNETTLKLEENELEEKHEQELSNLRTALSLSFKDELLQVRTNLTERYYNDLQEQKICHALELEQQRARLSESHIRELTRIRHKPARQVELTKELTEEQPAFLEEAQKTEWERPAEELTTSHREELQEGPGAQLSTMRGGLERQMEEQNNKLKRELEEERGKLKSLQASLESDQSPQFVHMKQRLETRYDGELQMAKSCMAAEIKELTLQLHQAEQRFQTVKAELEQCLAQKDEVSFGEPENKHQADLEHQRTTLLNKHAHEMETLAAKHKVQLDALSASHRDQLAAMVTELDAKHKDVFAALEETLDSKWRAELEGQEVVLQESNQSRLKALEAELSGKHREERDELESRLLGNMDTLEATFLKEVQTLRDEISELEQRHREEVNGLNLAHGQETERQKNVQQSIREELGKELTQVHMEKFSAMAAELSHVHKAELSAQKEALDVEHCKALETLKMQVLELEEQHGSALQELQNTYATKQTQLTEQLQLHELRAVSARELACRQELEEESSRQRLHVLQEEMALLKVQSEERLQDSIVQLKAELEHQKEAELEEQRRRFSAEHEQKERSYTDKMSQLTIQLQQLDAVVTQLRLEVDCLQGELEGKRAEMETLDTLLQRRDRESQEGSNLLTMLTEDLKTAKEERHNLKESNETLRKLLLQVVRCTIATEELIGQKVNTGTKKSAQPANQRGCTGDSLQSEVSAEELELTQLLCESLLVSEPQLHAGGEEAALGACNRLHHTVDMLLKLLNQANAQLEQTHNIHLSLEERFSRGKEDSTKLLKQHKLLLEQLDQEAEQKSSLQLELHKAEGLLEGYKTEKASLDEALQQKEEQEERLVEELEDLKVKLQDMEGLSVQMEGLVAQLESLKVRHQELSEEHAVLLHQRNQLTAGLGEREKALVEEAERLARERLDLQRQAEKDRNSLSLRLRALESELEEQETKGLEMELKHKTHTEDLDQHIGALEKQLKNNRQFIDEQAVEREHERDEFQQEIHRLEAQLRQTNRGQVSMDNRGQRIEDLVFQVESLQALIKDKTEDHDSLLTASQQAQRDLTERNEEIDKLAGRIRELEQALLSSAESSRAMSQLEQELHSVKLREQELTQDKQALEQQQLSNRLQISALQSKLDETRHCYHDNTPDPTQQLRDALDTAQQNLQSKEREVDILVAQLEQVQSDLSIKEVELKHLTLQLELLANQNMAHVSQLQEQIATLKENVAALSILQEEREERDDGDEESLPSALLQEKNQEIDQLNQEIHKLEQELDNSKHHETLVAEMEDLHSQVEHLRCDINRLRHDKQEEEERLHEVISTLQAELSTPGRALEEISDSQDGDSVNPSPSPSPEPHHHTIRGPESLKQELHVTRSAVSRSRVVEALQAQLETAAAEKEALERLLLTQEEEYQGHGKEMGKRLKEEREHAEELKGLLLLKEAELEEVKTHTERLEVVEKKKLALEEEGEEQKKKEAKMEREMETLREANQSLDRLMQESSAQLVAMEQQVADGRAEVITLETVKRELSAEREALRKREGCLQFEIERLRQEVESGQTLVQELGLQLKEMGNNREETLSQVLTHAEVTLAKSDVALRDKEAELARLGAEHQALKAELAAVKEGLSTSTERADKLQEEGQTKDRALADLETHNQRLKAELRGLQEDLAVQEEELAYQQRELHHLRQRCHYQHDNRGYSQKDISQRGFEDNVCVSRDDASLSSPEVLRRLECSEDGLREGIHVSVLQDSHLSALSALSCTGLNLHLDKASPCARMEPPRSRTITPEPATQSTRSPGSVSACDDLSVVCSLGADKEHDLETLDMTDPPSALGSTSDLSAPEWASDGYGSNVSSELGVRLRVELEQTERLDAQFVEYLRCRGMNPTANTDSAAGSMSYSDDLLSPELQELLKKVYEESCRILTLSQRRTASSSQLQAGDSNARLLYRSDDGASPLDRSEKSLSAPPMGWQQEKRALQETVLALRELLCRMAQRDTRTGGRGDADCQREALQVEKQLRAKLEEMQKQLNCTHDAHQEQNNRIQSLRLAVEEGEETLRMEQTTVQELQQQLEQERLLAQRTEREVEERQAALQESVEHHGSEVVALKGHLEQERVACSNLRSELQIEQSRSGLLEKRLNDAHEAHEALKEEHHQRFARQQNIHSQERSHLEQLLGQVESRLADAHSQLAGLHKNLEEERERCSRQLDEFSRRAEADMARERKFIADMRVQLEQERRQGEELVAAADRLRSELLQARRSGEKEDQRRAEESHREQESAARLRLATETLKEQRRESSRALETERERSSRQASELTQLKERLQLLNNKERQKEEQRQRERRKERQELIERERRQEMTNGKLCELESLRRQDQQRMQDLQRTLAELQREERDMATQRLSGSAAAQPAQQTTEHSVQSSTLPSTALVEQLLGENSELTERVTTLSQERVSLKHTLACLERQLRHTENELAQISTETENRPLGDAASHRKVQRLYERYLRAESFRKSLVYQKRYLLLLLGGFQDCEQATLCLIAHMGARPSPSVQPQRRPLTRFRAAVRVVLAISRMKFLTKKWQSAIRRLSKPGTVGSNSSVPRREIFKQQQRSNSEPSPPTRDSSPVLRDATSTLVPPIKSPFRLQNRSYSGTTAASGYSGATSQDPERSLTEYIHHLEKVQQRLVGIWPVNEARLAWPPREEVRRQGQTTCSPDMIGYRQRWLQENRTWLYLSCLSPLYLYGPGSAVLHLQTKKPEH